MSQSVVPRWAARGALWGALVLGLATAAPDAGLAQAAAPKPWRPSRADSITIWATRSLQTLSNSSGTKLGAEQVQAFSDLGQLGRLYFESLGPARMHAAGGLVAMLDSLGHRVRVYSDPRLPAFTLVQFLHPVLDGGVSLCYLYWFRGLELLQQPINLHGGMEIQFRAYWLDAPRTPYEAAILFRSGSSVDDEWKLFILQLAPDASGWLPLPGGAEPRPLGHGGDAEFVELNGNLWPEIATWTLAAVDPLFSLCAEPSCPRHLEERLYWRHEQKGFQLVSQRPVASALNTFMEFVLALRRGEEARARSLVSDAKLVADAKRYGLDKLSAAGALRIAASRCRECWPERQTLETVFSTDGTNWILDSLEGRGGASGESPSRPTGSRPGGSE